MADMAGFSLNLPPLPHRTKYSHAVDTQYKRANQDMHTFMSLFDRETQ